MYIRREPQRRFELAVQVVALPFFDNSITIKEIAQREQISEKTLFFWKGILLQGGPLLFADLHPGRRSFREKEEEEKKSSLLKKELDKKDLELLISQVVNRLLIGIINEELQPQRRFSASTKLRILEEQDRVKKLYRVSYIRFSLLIGIDERTLRLWRSRYNPDEGVKSLESLSTAPKQNAMKLDEEITREIVQFGSWWQRRRGGIKITEFSCAFRKRYSRLLISHDRVHLDDKTIARYLREANLYGMKQERKEAKRGSFCYYFPGAQAFADTCQVYLFGIRLYLVAVMEAFSRGILHQSAFLRETKEAVIKSLDGSFKEAKRWGIKILSMVMDHGKPYKAGETKKFLTEREVLRIFSPPYWPEGKAALERYFRTVQSFIYARPKEVLKVLIKGLLRWMVKRLKEGARLVVISFLKVFLISVREEYNAQLKNTGGELPSKEVRGAVKKILEERARKSSLKGEFIGKLHREFELPMPRPEAVEFLSRYRRQAIEEAAEALRRKLTLENLSPERRWLYLAKTAFNINEEKKEAEIAEAERVLKEEEQRRKEKEERENVLKERRWRDEHPEEAIFQSIDAYLLLHENIFSRRHFQREIKEMVRKIIRKNSSLTLRYEMDRILAEVKERNPKGLSKKLRLPLPDETVKEEARAQLTSLIKETCLQYRGEARSSINLRDIIKLGRVTKPIAE